VEALGRSYNIVPIAAGVEINMREVDSVDFVCTGNDTFTVTSAPAIGGSYTSPGNIVTNKYTNTSTAGAAKWVRASQAASNAVVSASGTVVFTVNGASLADGQTTVKCSVGGSGLVTAVLHDLKSRRAPANLPAVAS
jgi:hypothetical protein